MRTIFAGEKAAAHHTARPPAPKVFPTALADGTSVIRLSRTDRATASWSSVRSAPRRSRIKATGRSSYSGAIARAGLRSAAAWKSDSRNISDKYSLKGVCELN